MNFIRRFFNRFFPFKKCNMFMKNCIYRIIKFGGSENVIVIEYIFYTCKQRTNNNIEMQFKNRISCLAAHTNA